MEAILKIPDKHKQAYHNALRFFGMLSVSGIAVPTNDNLYSATNLNDVHI